MIVNVAVDSGRMSPTAFLFERKGVIGLVLGPEETTAKDAAFDMLFELAVEAGAEDVRVVEPTEDDQAGGFEVSRKTSRIACTCADQERSRRRPRWSRHPQR